MSYFIHGGTQYPFGQSTTPQNQTNSNSTNASNVSTNYYGNSSYLSSQNSSDFSTSYPSSTTTSKIDYTSSYNTQSYGSASTGSLGGYGSQAQNRLGTGTAGTVGTRNYSNTGNTAVSSSYDSSSYSSSYTQGSGSYTQGSTATPASSGFSSNYKSYDTGASTGSQYQTSNYQSNSYEPSAYEKVLYNAANQYFSSSNRRGGRGGYNRGNKRGGRGGLGRGGISKSGNSGTQSSSQNTGPKPIKASEVKAYLYAWCGQRKLKPEYEISPKGTQPKVTFSCKLVITGQSGLDYVAEVEAGNKKDAQSKAAWDFCENLVKMGYMKTTELPPKPCAPTPKSSLNPSTEAIGSLPPESVEEITKHGGWTLSNSRQRLNQFCQREHLSPDFKHQTLGPEHARVFICDLKINVKSLQKEFTASERGSNKKQATAVCALSMVRQLYGESLIEKFGDPIKHVTRGSLIEGKAMHIKSQHAFSAAEDQSRKRKAEDQSVETIDENGNWTLENSRQRLNQYCQINGVPCDVIYAEEGQPGSRTYTASVNLKVKKEEEENDLTACSRGHSKKLAAQGCALQLLAQLYKLTLVEANLTSTSPLNKKKNSNGRMKGSWLANDHSMMFGGRVPLRRTVVQDIYINEKHKQIYPTEKELDVVQKAVRVVELALKDVADELTEPCDTPVVPKKEPEIKTESEVKSEDVEMAEVTKKRKLQSVIRVGTLAKGLLLKGDLNVELVLLCQEAPTQKLLVQVAQCLPKHLKVPTDSDKVNVELAIQHTALVVSYTVVTDGGSMTVKVTVFATSPIIRNPSSDTGKETPSPLNKEKCLQSLAEVRHAKWFQACANGIPSCIIVIRILRELTSRVAEWQSLNDWTIELIVEKALRTAPVPLSLGGSFQRVLECISSGILLPGHSSVMDPCERDTVDAAGNLTNQERENITTSAQNFLRLFAFRQHHKVLGMDEIKRNSVKDNTEPEPTET